MNIIRVKCEAFLIYIIRDIITTQHTNLEKWNMATSPEFETSYHTQDETLRGINLLPLAKTAIESSISFESTNIDGANAVLGTE